MGDGVAEECAGNVKGNMQNPQMAYVRGNGYHGPEYGNEKVKIRLNLIKLSLEQKHKIKYCDEPKRMETGEKAQKGR